MEFFKIYVDTKKVYRKCVVLKASLIAKLDLEKGYTMEQSGCKTTLHKDARRPRKKLSLFINCTRNLFELGLDLKIFETLNYKSEIRFPFEK